MKIWVPCSKVVTNFKTVTTEHETKHGALLSLGTGPHTYEAGPGKDSLHERLSCPPDILVQVLLLWIELIFF